MAGMEFSWPKSSSREAILLRENEGKMIGS